MSKNQENLNIWQASLPYNALPPLPPNKNLESIATLKACLNARVALAELNQSIELIPDSSLLINLLPILEAKGSSAIENIVTTTDKLYEFAAAPNLKDTITKEAYSYRHALKFGFDSLSDYPLCTRTLTEVCSLIKSQQMDIRKIPGTTLSNNNAETIYTPPVGEKVLRDLLANWESFIHSESNLDPLIIMAIAHYQLEAIHPFIDGNGRTGRIFNILFLIEKKLLKSPILYLSRHIVENKSDYYNLLLNVTKDQDWEPWIIYMLNAVEETSLWTKEKISSIRKLMNETKAEIQTNLPKIYSFELIEVLFSQPYCRIQNLVDKDIAKRQTASEYLQKLAEKNILRIEQKGIEKLFINTKLLNLMKDQE
jgi:Fic family protein